MTTIVLISDLTFEHYERQAGPAGAGCRGGGHLDIVVTEMVNINRFWINARSKDILGARKKVMDLFYKMEGKDMYVENGSVVAAPYYQEG